jgi:tetratricopeptide (TPR) repeat protein
MIAAGSRMRSKMRAASIVVVGLSLWAGLMPSAQAFGTDACLQPTYQRAAQRAAACSALIDAGDGTADVYAARGYAYLQLRDYARSVGDYSMALQLRPYDAEAFSGRGYAYVLQGEYNRAISDISKALDMRPDAGDFYRRGYAFYLRGDRHSAIVDYSSALAMKPNEPTWLNSRCWARAVSGIDLELALVDCDAALRQARKNTDANDSRGLVYFRLKDYGKAIVDYDTVLGTSSLASDRKARAYFMRGVSKLRRGEAAAPAAGGEVPLSSPAFEGHRRAMSAAEDIAMARSLDPGVDAYFKKMRIEP